MDPYQLAKYWLDVVDYCLSAGFVPIKEESLKQEQAWADAVKWNYDFFSAAANPCARESEDLPRVHVADKIGADIMRHSYRVEILNIDVFESAAFSVVRFEYPEKPLLKLPPDERKTVFADRVAKLLSEKTQIRPDSFVLPDGAQLDEGCLMSTNEKEDTNVMFYWPERIDAGIRDGVPFVLLYKKSVGRLGFAPLIGWFSEQLRTGG